MKTKNSEEYILTVIVPVYNEQENLPALINHFLPFCQARKWKLIFVDDGSIDASAKILDALAIHEDVRVIHHKVNRGYGGALKSGIRETLTPYSVTVDADGQHRIEEVENLLEKAIQTNADLVIGSRVSSRENRFRAIGKWLIRKFASLLMNIPIKDLNSGFKLYRTDLVKRYIYLCPNTMAFSDIITLVFINQRNLVLEHPITVEERQGGKSTINVMTAIETIIEIINIIMLFNPPRIFLPISAFSILVGVVWGIPILISGRGVSVGSMLAIVTGLLFFAIGLIANQLAVIRLESLNNIE
jgi:glycosyltransferase involved in cell wall biosynthesis